MVAELSIGYVAGLIALGMFLAQFLFPTIINFIIGGLLEDKETAATWTVAGRALQTSYWPEVLRTDSARLRSVRGRVRVFVLCIPLTAALVAIAGVVTPLGLYDAMETSGTTTVPFAYVRDTSTFGFGTPDRSNLSFARSCSMLHGFMQGPAPCPYSDNLVVFSWNGSAYTWDMPYGYSSKIPDIVREIYSSGTKGLSTTVSNYFDIDWRQWNTRADKHTDNGTAHLIGSYRQIESVVLKDAVLAIEGLVVDARNGSIGFRNHTLPVGLKYGASWQEDLLFVSPETVCVDTNLTLDFTINNNASETLNGQVSELFLTDRGGFANLNTTYPYYDRKNAQLNADLWGRAYKAAWLNNAWSMMYLNVTNPNNETTGKKSFAYLNSEVGKRFELPRSSTNSYSGLKVGNQYGGYLLSSAISSKGGNYSNPFGVTSEDFRGISIICSGAGDADIANITNIYVGCGLMQAVPHRIDGGSTMRFEGDSKWSAPLYSCASAVKANIKTVSFLINSTQPSLEALAITEIHEKRYSDENEYPIWGMEDSGLALDGISPIWGLISPEYKKFPNISVVQKPDLYIAGTGAIQTLNVDSLVRGGYQYMPGSDFPEYTMNSVYNPNSLSQGIADYTGASNMAMLLRWRNLSSTPQDAGKILNLMWTDIAAQGVVGTKGRLGAGNADPSVDATRIPVTPIQHQVKYKWPFAIPAFLLALVLVVFSLMAIISAAVGKARFGVLRKRLNQTSTGRIFTNLHFPAHSNNQMPSKEWNKTFGHVELDMSLPLPNSVSFHDASGNGGEYGHHGVDHSHGTTYSPGVTTTNGGLQTVGGDYCPSPVSSVHPSHPSSTEYVAGQYHNGGYHPVHGEDHIIVVDHSDPASKSWSH